jgi:indole-3-glycerol phosphate synthase
MAAEILKEIVTKKKEKIKDAKARRSRNNLLAAISDIKEVGDFKAAIKRSADGKINLIAEIKKASPSKGIIRKDFDHLSIARTYEKEAINAISILTEEDFFLGNLNFLSDVRKVVTKPILRKDFIIDEYQIFESRANEADAILLIAAILDKKQADEYFHLARELNLSVLFEVHNFKELEIALSIDSDIIGINNRDLKTLQVDINTTLKLKKEIPTNKILVSESGIKTREHVRMLEDAGIDSILVGTAFMEAKDIGKKIKELTGNM